ncbi:DUF2975 domain-containing protein [Nocardiopsis ganjiahuensis]|uniref:DUF2975 domain-containing protein n=1 Tax=Nocardiopsis ganjiahuensis TaxID=239984 RepID=UPI0003483E21|nr:DUF2975 domain-containing protein [Nocardiopsis ganjiahuensis]
MSSPGRPRIHWTRADSVLLQGTLFLGLLLLSLSFLATLLWILAVVPAGAMGWMNEITVHHTSEVARAVPDVTLLADDVGVRGTDTLVLVFEDPGAPERLLLALPVLLQQVLGLVVVGLVLRMLQSLSSGDPFVPANVRRVYAVAFAVLLGSLLLPVVESVCDIALWQDRVPVDEVALLAFDLGLGSGPLTGFLVGLLLVSLAEVFRRGARMREDVEGLV